MSDLWSAFYRIRKQDRRLASPKPGLRQGWTEYQVTLGRKVVARYDTLKQAQADYPHAKVKGL
jgi:hypothetical protein